MELMYEPLAKQPKFTTISIPLEALSRSTQNATLVTPGPFLTTNPTPPSLPVPPFPNDETPTPPSSPSPQTALDPPARPLWTNDISHTPPTMEISSPHPMQPRIQCSEEPMDTDLRLNTPRLDPSPPLLCTIVTSNRDHVSLANVARNALWDPIDKYNKAPMPKIQDASPTAIFNLIDISVIDEWDTFTGGKVAAIPFGNNIHKLPRHDSICKKIFAAAAEITKSKQTAVAGSRPHVQAKPDARPPYTFLIYNLSELQRRTLLERTVWSSADITFRVTTLLPTKPDFLFSIVGLSTLATDDVRDMIFKTWWNKENLITVQKAIQTTDDNAPKTSLCELEDFLNSLEVKRLDIKEKKGALAPEFNVYADANYIQDPNVWGDLCHILANQQYHSTMLGCGLVRSAPFNCKICHGADHPSGLCPFPNITSWKGPNGRDSDEDQTNGNEGNRGPPLRQDVTGVDLITIRQSLDTELVTAAL